MSDPPRRDPLPTSWTTGSKAGPGPTELIRAGMPLVHLRIGECHTSDREQLVATVLGSCVSAVLHHPRLGLGGIYHAMLPDSNFSRTPELEPCKFVDTATAHLLEYFDDHNVPRHQIKALLFGGAMSMKGDLSKEVLEIVDVGRKNVKNAEQALKDAGIAVLRRDVLGNRGRKLFFRITTGEVWVQMLSPII